MSTLDGRSLFSLSATPLVPFLAEAAASPGPIAPAAPQPTGDDDLEKLCSDPEFQAMLSGSLFDTNGESAEKFSDIDRLLNMECAGEAPMKVIVARSYPITQYNEEERYEEHDTVVTNHPGLLGPYSYTESRLSPEAQKQFAELLVDHHVHKLEIDGAEFAELSLKNTWQSVLQYGELREYFNNVFVRDFEATAKRSPVGGVVIKIAGMSYKDNFIIKNAMTRLERLGLQRAYDLYGQNVDVVTRIRMMMDADKYSWMSTTPKHAFDAIMDSKRIYQCVMDYTDRNIEIVICMAPFDPRFDKFQENRTSVVMRNRCIHCLRNPSQTPLRVQRRKRELELKDGGQQTERPDIPQHTCEPQDEYNPETVAVTSHFFDPIMRDPANNRPLPPNHPFSQAKLQAILRFFNANKDLMIPKETADKFGTTHTVIDYLAKVFTNGPSKLWAQEAFIRFIERNATPTLPPEYTFIAAEDEYYIGELVNKKLKHTRRGLNTINALIAHEQTHGKRKSERKAHQIVYKKFKAIRDLIISFLPPRYGTNGCWYNWYSDRELLYRRAVTQKTSADCSEKKASESSCRSENSSTASRPKIITDIAAFWFAYAASRESISVIPISYRDFKVLVERDINITTHEEMDLFMKGVYAKESEIKGNALFYLFQDSEKINHARLQVLAKEYCLIGQGTQLRAGLRTNLDEAQRIYQKLMSNCPRGVTFNQDDISAHIDGGACSAMSLHFVNEALKKWGELTKDSSEIQFSRLTHHLFKIRQRYEGAEIEFRTPQSVFNTISCIWKMADAAPVDYGLAKMQALANLHALELSPATENISFSDKELFQKTLSALPVNEFYVWRLLQPANEDSTPRSKEKGEIEGHTMVVAKLDCGGVFYDPNRGEFMLPPSAFGIDDFLYQSFHSYNRSWKLTECRFYKASQFRS